MARFARFNMEPETPSTDEGWVRGTVKEDATV
jgi:hypothetical protein